MTDGRNFRSAYLGKVGIKGVEEKKSIEMLLKEDDLDVNKLMQFCLRFIVPAAYRIYVWKVILGVLPANQSSHQYVIKQRLDQFNDLSEAVTTMKRIHSSTPQSQVHLKMFLLQERLLPFEEDKMLQNNNNKQFINLAEAMAEFTDEIIDVYWLTTMFHKHLEKINHSINLMKERVEYYVINEDGGDRKLHSHLCELQVYRNLPFESWFNSAFSGVLPNSYLDRIWDKVIAGSCKVLVYVAVAILLTYKRPLLSMNSAQDITKYLSKIPEDSGDIIVSKALNLWQKNGSQLQPRSTKSDSPSSMSPMERAPS